MSDGRDRGERRRLFLSSHRCPEVDFLPHQDSEAQFPPQFSHHTAPKKPEPNCNYLEVSTQSSDDINDSESFSDWSDEDLSLHLPPSVILQLEDEESDPESSFECVDINIETLVKAQEGEGPKMVPKRQIQRKRKDSNSIVKETNDKLQVKDGPPAETEVIGERLASNSLTAVQHRPDVLLRQHSMPASFQTSGSDGDNYRVSKGLTADASQGTIGKGNSKQRLQKSFSLDETKTKMASCIIKSVLHKKMQAELSNCQVPRQQSRPTGLPRILQSGDVPRGREGREGETGGLKAPIHVVRDVRSLVKNTSSLQPSGNKLTSLKVIGQKESPPPTYQQAVASNRVTHFGQSQHNKYGNRSSRPATQQRRESDTDTIRSTDNPAIESIRLLAPPTNIPTSSDHFKPSQQVVAPTIATTAVSVSAPCANTKPDGPEECRPSPLTQEQSSVPGLLPKFAPFTSQQILHPCFYTPAALPALPTFPPSLTSQLAEGSYVQGPLSYIPTLPAASFFHLLTASQENKSKRNGNVTDQQDQNPAVQTGTSVNQRDRATSGTSKATQRQHTSHDRKVSSPASAPAAGLSNASHRHVTDATPLQFFYVNTPPLTQRKMLLDPETGQYVQVLLPASASAGSCTFPVGFANPAHFPPSMLNPTPTVLSVMQIQPTVTVSSLYAPSFQPIPLHSSALNFTNTQ